jgi:hypothetical protein
MAEAQQESTDKARKKTGSTTKNETRKRASRGKTARRDGAERLRQAADRQVGRNSKKLADLLTEKALKGDLASTRVLVGLAERKKPKAEPAKKRRGPGLAERLAVEPEWQKPPERKQETDGGEME